MDFYKIVLWLTDDGNLKATAFILSQVELVSDIDFEQLDLDQNTEFKEFNATSSASFPSNVSNLKRLEKSMLVSCCNLLILH